LQSIEVAPNTRKNDDEISEYERGRRRRGSEVRPPVDQERPRRTRPLRTGTAKRRLKEEDRDEEYSSDLSSAPSRSSRPNSPSHPMRRRAKHSTGHQKPKVHGGSSASEGDNSDREDTRQSRLRSRKRRRSLMDSSPPNHRIKSSPPISPQPLGSPIKSTRSREKAHAGQRTLKHRKLPAPLLTNRGDISSSSSRDNSPSSVPRLRRPQSVRTPGSPMSTSHKPKRDTAGRTHLHRACQRGDVAEVEAILNAGKEFLNAEDNAGYQPLHEACLHGHLEVAKILIENGAQIDQPSKIEQDTPLLDAVDNGHTDVVRYLLELGANPRKRNKQGQTAMDANESNRETEEVFEEIEGLLKTAISELRKQRPSDDETARASVAADSHSSRDPSVASPVHQSPPAPSIPSGARRRNARTEQSRKDLLWLDPGKNGLQKLREKAREGDQQMVHALLERGTKPDTESLIGAIKGGHADTVSLLLAYGDTIVDPEPGSSQGHRKTRDNSMPAAEETPMLAAIGRGNLTVLGYLLANGVNPRRLDHKGKSYMDIAREREGDLWQDEVEMLQKAYDKAGGGKIEKITRRGHSPENYRSTSPKPKKLNDTKGTSSGSRRPNSTLASANTPRRSASTGPSRWSSTSANPTKYEDTTAVSDQEEVSAEPLGPPKNRSKKGKRSESDSLAPPVAKKKRRLISGKDLANEESLARSSQEPTRSVPPESDLDSKEKPSAKNSTKKHRANSAMEETIRVEQKPIIPRKLRMGSEDTRISDSATERATHKARNDDSNLLRPDNIPSPKDKKPTLGGKRDRTRSPTAHSDSGRKLEKEEPRKQRKLVDKQEKYDSDSTLKQVTVKEEGKSRKPPTTRRDSPDGRRQSVSTTEASEKEDQRQRILREREDTERDRREREKRQRARGEKEDVKRRAESKELRRQEESKEQRRQEALRKELESILEKAREESKRASVDQVIDRELEVRRQREEKDRRERELREREEREQEEREAREAREKEIREREEAAAREIRRRQAAEREAKEREAKEREAKEREEREEREARESEAREREAREREAREREAREREIKEREAERKRREEELRQAEETRKREEAIRRAEQEVLQKKLAEEQRRKEEAEKQRLEAAENQRRAAEAERKLAEEEARKRQEFERAEKEALARREAELLQQQLAAERKRIEDEEQRELARKRALPFALREIEEKSNTPVESSRFMPLYSAVLPPQSTANSTSIKPGMNGCGPQKPQQYILNVQAALVLGSTDLQFSSCTLHSSSCSFCIALTNQSLDPDIHRREVDDQHRSRMWSVLSVMLCESVHLSGHRSIEELEKSRREEREKFLKMSPVFWMKVCKLSKN
jgi:ankyrin repeat protein